MEVSEAIQQITKLLTEAKGHAIVTPRIVLRDGRMQMVSNRYIAQRDILIAKLTYLDVQDGLEGTAWNYITQTLHSLKKMGIL